jgi:hypothetical protein
MQNLSFKTIGVIFCDYLDNLLVQTRQEDNLRI